MPHQGKELHLRCAEIGQGTVIARALPHREKRMIGAWCFLDHAGPVEFVQSEGLDIGPHPHIGLQTFTWMIEGTLMHTDSLGSKQLIQPKQVNLMTAGYGISHTEVTPPHETQLHTAQLWIALPDDKRNMPAKFQHYPKLPVIQKDQIECRILVGDFLGHTSPVEVYSPLLAVDLYAAQATQTTLPLKPDFEYGILLLSGQAQVNGHVLTTDNMLIFETGSSDINLVLAADSRVLLIGGEPFESPILLWWNYVGRSEDEIKAAHQHWLQHDSRFGEIPDYPGKRLQAPAFPEHMRASK